MTKMNVLIATPCYGGLVHHTYFMSMLDLMKEFAKFGIDNQVIMIPAESLIQRARNFYVSIMLTCKQYTHLLFLDADIGFSGESIVRMLLKNKEIVCGIYPKKGLNWKRIKATVQNLKEDIDDLTLENKVLDYCINLESGKSEVDGGLMKILYGGTGCMIIDRNVIEKMAAALPETKYKNDVDGYSMSSDANGDNFYALFDCIIDPKSKRYLSEDYTFIYRARELGIETYADLQTNLTHTGSYTFKGSFFSTCTIETKN